MLGTHMSWRSKDQTLLILEGQDKAPQFWLKEWGKELPSCYVENTLVGIAGNEEGRKQNQASGPANLKETEVARPVTDRANKFS